MKRKIKRKYLLNPGPSTTTDSVKYAQVVSDICPREQEYGQVLSFITSKLTKLAGGNKEHTTILLGGSGTAAMDASVNSFVPPGQKIAVINNGAYGQRLINIARSYGITVVNIPFAAKQCVDVKKVSEVISKDSKIGVLAIVHHETTTGRLNPLREVAHVAKENNKLFLVDAISSFAGLPINIAKDNIDVLLSTSNKCLQGMPGLAFVVCKKSTIEKTSSYRKRSFYLNLYQQYEYFLKTGQMQFTPPVQVSYALRQAIIELEAEGGVRKRYQRYTANWRAMRQGLDKLGFSFYLRPQEESHILITVYCPRDPMFDFNNMHERLYRRGITIYPGKVSEDNTFRLAVMGDLQVNDIQYCLKEMGVVLRQMGVKDCSK